MEKNMVETIRYATGNSSLGPFSAASSDRGLAMVEFGVLSVADVRVRFPDADVIEDTASLQEMLGKLTELIEHPERHVELAFDLRGSDFELRVWQALRHIPAGTTTTYGEIAARLGAPRDAREVGEACANNKLVVVVPCHRVVKKGGSIAGYRWGTRRKRVLLEREHRANLLRPSAAVPHGTAAT
jgi:AraC family transcriptional regulator of adaptative response/methylated-DNA-[protein]-cysteine methyltransferase